MADFATPNLPARDFEETSGFYGRLGFAETYRDEGWMILKHGALVLEFFRHSELDPATSWFSCCLRLDDVQAMFDTALAAGIPEKRVGWPRVHRPRHEDWGGVVGAIIEPNGSLIRLVQN